MLYCIKSIEDESGHDGQQCSVGSIGQGEGYLLPFVFLAISHSIYFGDFSFWSKYIASVVTPPRVVEFDLKGKTSSNLTKSSDVLLQEKPPNESGCRGGHIKDHPHYETSTSDDSQAAVHCASR